MGEPVTLRYVLPARHKRRPDMRRGSVMPASHVAPVSGQVTVTNALAVAAMPATVAQDASLQAMLEPLNELAWQAILAGERALFS